jgi:hypothetical protein
MLIVEKLGNVSKRIKVRKPTIDVRSRYRRDADIEECPLMTRSDPHALNDENARR